MKVQITNGMFMALIINMLYAKSIGLTQGIMAREVGGDIWISTIFSSIQGIVIMAIVIFAIKRLPNGDMIDQYGQILGKWIGKGVAALVFLFFLGAYGTIMATFVYHLKDYFLPEAHTILFIVAAFLIGSYAIHFGIEVIARMALIGVFSVMALNILLLAGSISEFDIKELQPTFDSGFFSTLWASRHHDADWAMATMMACMILPLVRDSATWIRSSTSGLIFSGVIIVMWPILEVGVLSPEVAAQYIVSCMQMARSAEIGLFLHRYEMIMIAFFALSILTQIMMTFLCSSIAVQKIIGLKDYRPVIIPVGLVLSAFSYWMIGSHHRAMGIIEKEWVLVSLSIAIGLPGMLFVLGAIFKKKLKKKEDAKTV
ncbi:GerAB/ArcD/ProY family transporter [Niallia sp. FSL R7-0271]|uniref:GerAB/ArcD/ProY family transporter n=1 Tax=Niallia sp. FSL R7-0271 TaxID=2921678 RepID=UPI0030FB077D